MLSPSRAGRIPAATNHNNTEAVTSNTLALKKKDQQIEMYRQKLAESYEEREQEQLESKVTLRVRMILCKFVSCSWTVVVFFDMCVVLGSRSVSTHMYMMCKMYNFSDT